MGLPKESTDTHSDWLARIAGSLYENNMPVFSYGIIGPPEPTIITGWDKDGEILTGWSFFQSYPWQGAGDFEPDGRFRKRGWLEGNLCLLVIGQKKPRPELSATFRSALEWGLQVYRTPKVFPEPDAPEWVATKWNGRAALQAWEASLLDDTNFPAGDDATLRHRHTIINSVAGNLAEARSMADVFLQQIAAIIPAAAPDLIHAGKLYQAEHDLVYRLWNICPGLDRPDAALKLPDAGSARPGCRNRRDARKRGRSRAKPRSRAAKVGERLTLNQRQKPVKVDIGRDPFLAPVVGAATVL